MAVGFPLLQELNLIIGVSDSTVGIGLKMFHNVCHSLFERLIHDLAESRVSHDMAHWYRRMNLLRLKSRRLGGMSLYPVEQLTSVVPAKELQKHDGTNTLTRGVGLHYFDNRASITIVNSVQFTQVNSQPIVDRGLAAIDVESEKTWRLALSGLQDTGIISFEAVRSTLGGRVNVTRYAEAPPDW